MKHVLILLLCLIGSGSAGICADVVTEEGTATSWQGLFTLSSVTHGIARISFETNGILNGVGVGSVFPFYDVIHGDWDFESDSMVTGQFYFSYIGSSPRFVFSAHCPQENVAVLEGGAFQFRGGPPPVQTNLAGFWKFNVKVGRGKIRGLIELRANQQRPGLWNFGNDELTGGLMVASNGVVYAYASAYADTTLLGTYKKNKFKLAGIDTEGNRVKVTATKSKL